VSPIVIKEPDQAMDFFHGLDASKYGEFKVHVKNGWAMKSMKPPTMVNEIYRLAGVWVKPNSRSESGTAATYVTEQVKKEAGAADKSNAAGKDGDKKPTRDLSKVKCYGCGKKGHLKNSPLCPKNIEKEKKASQEGRDAFMNATWREEMEAGMYATISCEDKLTDYVADAVVNTMQKVTLTQVLLDNQADISVIHPMLLKDVRPADKKIRVKGVGGIQLIVDKVGLLDGFFQVYVSENTKANVLSFAEVEDRYDISYVRGESFTVHMPSQDVVFERRNKLYIAEWCEEREEAVDGIANATMQENERLYTKEEVRRARAAYEFLRNSGYPSMLEAAHLISDGNVWGLPMLMKGDLERAHQIYGEHPEYVRGQMVRKTVGRAKADESLKIVQKNQKLYTDVMHVDTKMFLVTVTEPLNLTLQSKVENESRMCLGMGLQGQLAVLRSRGYMPDTVYTNPHSSFRTMTLNFPGVTIDIGGAGDYISKVDAKIRRIKDTYRKVKLGLSWDLMMVLVEDLVAYVVSRLNVRRMTSLSENVCPRVLFTGIPVDYRKELPVPFGDYV
jgi:hypothetical protein